jgi:phenylalanine-4-hydroxylase
LSSAGETTFCLSDTPSHFAYDVRHIFGTEYWKDSFQDKYWIIESYEQLFESLPEIEEVLEELLANR